MNGLQSNNGQDADGFAAFEGQGSGDNEGLWLSKEEAAALLGVRTRQIERREAAGMIRKRTLPRQPGQTTARVVYSRADLLALQAGAPNDYRPDSTSNSVAITPAAGSPAPLALNTGWLDAVAAVVARLQLPAAASADAPRPWLTLAEAAAYSGLPAAWLLKEAQAGYVAAIDLGGRPRGGRWRFRRDELGRIGS